MDLLLSLFFLCISLLKFRGVEASVNLQGSVVWNELCPNYRALGAAQVLLDDGQARIANVEKSGRFLLPDVPAGEHVLSVRAHDHNFEQVLVQVPSDGSNISKVVPFIPGTVVSSSAPRLPYPIKLSAVSKHEFFVPHESFNVMAMFGNPMMLMMVVGAVLIFATPYLSKYIDTDALKDAQGGQAGNRATNYPIAGSSATAEKEESRPTKVAGRRQPVSASAPKGRTGKARKK